ncbi:MAG: glycosyltransferase family 4 protein [Pseudothermotoga sp.]
MRIGLLHFRVGETDGVSLEMEKWKTVLERMNHEVIYIAGELNQCAGVKIPSLSMKNETNLWIHTNAFEKPSTDETTFAKVFEKYVEQIYAELEKKMPTIDLLVVNNVLSLGFNLAAAVAITRYAQRKRTKLLGHHHDFYWERERYSKPQYNFVQEILDNYFPPKGNDIFHITINNLAKKELLQRKGVESKVVPNVFDFDQPAWAIDDYNRDLRKTLNIDENDLVILHGTRIVQRKAIEIAMDFVEELKAIESRTVHFVIAGFAEKESQQYYERLVKKAQAMSFTTHFAHPIVRQSRHLNDRKYYSLWDTYVVADAVTYTSVLEGWGNQLIEAVFARKPLVVFEYPVYKSDIAPLGFDFISLSDKAVYNEKTGFYEIDRSVLQKAALKLKELLSNQEILQEKVQRNYYIGKKHLSLENLRECINEILITVASS